LDHVASCATDENWRRRVCVQGGMLELCREDVHGWVI